MQPSSGSLFSQLALWPYIRQYFNLRLVTWQGMRTHIMPLLTLFIPAIAVSLYKYMDKIMLGLLTTKAQVGFFENAERAINIPISVIASFGTVMLPKILGEVDKHENPTNALIVLTTIN
ncbi:oligosaccharide flippase family protein [Lactiplantibacillus plantarum]|uniref:oligosaccharide flippase family protein n=1 Tax=Lactiplantibacillus plantarum TaxID=1590 RepID=UPI0021C45C3C|nr:oligosaccharide flippase family protein [Lactiplantibacillus plantarum]